MPNSINLIEIAKDGGNFEHWQSVPFGEEPPPWHPPPEGGTFVFRQRRYDALGRASDWIYPDKTCVFPADGRNQVFYGTVPAGGCPLETLGRKGDVFLSNDGHVWIKGNLIWNVSVADDAGADGTDGVVLNLGKVEFVYTSGDGRHTYRPSTRPRFPDELMETGQGYLTSIWYNGTKAKIVLSDSPSGDQPGGDDFKAIYETGNKALFFGFRFPDGSVQSITMGGDESDPYDVVESIPYLDANKKNVEAELVAGRSDLRCENDPLNSWIPQEDFTGAFGYAEHTVYKSVALGGSKPATPDGGSFDFLTGTWTPPTGWLLDPPSISANNVLYCSHGHAAYNAGNTTDTDIQWGEPVVCEGTSDLNLIYRRSSTKPATPAATNATTSDPKGIPANWSDVPPSGTDTLWASQGHRPAASTLWTWGSPFQAEGTDGLSYRTLRCYRIRSRGATRPSEPRVTYSVANGVFTVSTITTSWTYDALPTWDPIDDQIWFSSVLLRSDETTASGTIPRIVEDSSDVSVVWRRRAASTTTAPSSGPNNPPTGWFDKSTGPTGDDPLHMSVGHRNPNTANWVWQPSVVVEGTEGVTAAAVTNPSLGYNVKWDPTIDSWEESGTSSVGPLPDRQSVEWFRGATSLGTVSNIQVRSGGSSNPGKVKLRLNTNSTARTNGVELDGSALGSSYTSSSWLTPPQTWRLEIENVECVINVTREPDPRIPVVPSPGNVTLYRESDAGSGFDYQDVVYSKGPISQKLRFTGNSSSSSLRVAVTDQGGSWRDADDPSPTTITFRDADHVVGRTQVEDYEHEGTTIRVAITDSASEE